MGKFSAAQWTRIRSALSGNDAHYGLPARRSRSLVLSSFNIRKFGTLKRGRRFIRSNGAWDLLVQYCERCDFIAIQEVLDDVSSVMQLRERLGKRYSLVLSDSVGKVPGRRGSPERLAFLFRNNRIRSLELASDISFERSAIFDTLFQHREKFGAAFQDRVGALADWEAKNVERAAAGKRKAAKPPFVLPEFVQFIRTPHLASFEAKGIGDADPYRFLAVNAHLMYGDKSKQREERWREFKALMAWLLHRAAELDRVFEPNIFLFGDLNLDLEKVDIRKRAVEKFLKSINSAGMTGEAKVNLPFLDAHPDMAGAVFRTNARRDQTYDQIALFARDKRLPPPQMNDRAGQGRVDTFDFGMFDFVQLFLDAVPAATKSSGKPNYSLFEHDVSDHMPIWIRLPRPVVGQPTFRWR